jgi:peptidoglycan/LPS O-acetylase OafA/YrhL
VGWKVFALSQVHLNDFATGKFTAGPWIQPLPVFLDQFAVGMAMAVVSVHGLPARATRLVARAWPWWLLAAILYWALCQIAGRPSIHVTTGAWLARHGLQALVAAALLFPAVFAWNRGGAVRRLLAWRPLLYVGLISYGVYLWNNALLIKLNGAIGGWMRDTLDLAPNGRFAVLLLAGVVITVAVASASYYAFERPLLSLKRLVGPEPGRAAPTEAIAEPAPAAPVAVK